MSETPHLGAHVSTPHGDGVVIDRDEEFAEALVQPDSDPSYSIWYDSKDLTVIGHDETALVWRGRRKVPAGPKRD